MFSTVVVSRVATTGRLMISSVHHSYSEPLVEVDMMYAISILSHNGLPQLWLQLGHSNGTGVKNTYTVNEY